MFFFLLNEKGMLLIFAEPNGFTVKHHDLIKTPIKHYNIIILLKGS